ncbi:NAD(P)-binding protein [Aaosphaeria arxii CBS 175.79]|uniref:NAD(P)-binding protein n=1 Tax=Aaosphaeria arxii CBS 175.79 TaxID=1450172 RepID=A0A6A5XPW2_9PLEO|nr:NAD(P)-binding protein [Aaosphaeria arxii CBS 175.79]KAF2014384.1 NAD(P)-binding protein [Aaosphaeria arxii CBS 175.79]
MASLKLIVVVGATGMQGGSVVNTFLNEPGWRVRGLTRNATSSKASALQGRGVEVVEGNLDNPSSLSAAFKDANIVFAVSDFWSNYLDSGKRTNQEQPGNIWAAEQETQQLKNVIDVASGIDTLERFVISSLSNVEKASSGKYKNVFHFDSKDKAVEYAREQHPQLWKKTSIIQAGWYISNFWLLPMMKPRKNADGIVQFTSQAKGESIVPYIAAEEDTGPLVRSLIFEPAGKNLLAYRELITMNEFVQNFTKATGLKAEVVTVPASALDYPEDAALEFAETFDHVNEFGYPGANDPAVIHPKDLKGSPKLGSVVEFLKKQDWTTVF